MSPSTMPLSRSAALTRRLLAAVALMGCLAPLPSAQAADPTQPFCIPQVINVPGPTFRQPPSIDGVVSNDLGWTNARRHVFINGTPVWDAAIQALRDEGFLYFSFEVNHDDAFDTEDAIYLAFDPTGMDVDRRLLRINPVIASGVAVPVAISYWHGYNPAAVPVTAAWSSATLPAGTVVAATVSGTAPNVSWTVELKIPRAAFGIPAAGPFGIYFNITPVIQNISLYYEYRWPEGTIDLSGNPLEAKAAWTDRTKWGEATTAATTCNGVYIAPSDIRTDNMPSSKINLNAPNTFRVTAHNSTVDATGAAVAANNVRATFKIANFGLPSMWTPIPAAPGPNPTASGNIAAGGTTDYTAQWTLTATEQATYNTAATRHQCILVELDTFPATNTQFANRSAWTNMNFGLASKFEATAQVDPRGWRRPAQGKQHELKLFSTSRVDELKPQEVLSQMSAPAGRELQTRTLPSDGRWSSLAGPIHFPVERDESWKEFTTKLNNPKARVSQSTTLYHGCRRTGIFLELGKDRKAELCERVGSYGYVLRHVSLGQAIAWKADVVQGPNLKATPAASVHELTVTERPMTVQHEIVATETEEKTSKDDGCGKLRLASGGGVLAAFAFTGFFWTRRRKSKQP